MSKGLDITQLLVDHRNGDKSALDALLPIIYDQLKSIANRELKRLWNGDTINSTALVHEAYIKMVKADALNAQNRAHFYALCSLGMRQIIVNYLEQKTAKKRGNEWEQVSLSDASISSESKVDLVLTIDKALKNLSQIDQKLTTLVEMRFFSGMSVSEVAIATDSSERTVMRNWSKAKAILNEIISVSSAPQDQPLH